MSSPQSSYADHTSTNVAPSPVAVENLADKFDHGTRAGLVTAKVDTAARNDNADKSRPEPFVFRDATVYGGSPSKEVLEREIEIASGRNASHPRGKWKNKTAKFGHLVDVLSRHEDGVKDGECILQGATIEGNRQASAIRHLDIIMLDLDTGQSMDEMRDKLLAKGLFAVLYSTYSHLKDVTDVKKDVIIKFAKLENGEEPTAEHVVNYLLTEKRYHPRVLEGAKLLGTEHKANGVMLMLKHQPMERFRVMMPLAKRFVIAERAGSQKDGITEWAERYAGVSEMLGAAYDRSCTDPSRLMYLPTHAKGAAFRIDIINGAPLDLEVVPRVSKRVIANDPFSSAAKELGAGREHREYQTPGLMKFVAKYGDMLEIDDLLLELDPDGDRGSRSSGAGRHHCCPNDDAHTDAGNPEDKACFAVNGSDSDTGFVLKCMHDSCSELDRVALLDLACVAAEIDDARDLRRFVAETVEDEEEEKAATAATPEAPEETEDEAPASSTKPFKHARHAQKAVDNLPRGDADAAAALVRRIALSGKALSPVQKQAMLDKVAQVAGVGKRALAAEMKQASASDDGYYSGVYDDKKVAAAMHATNAEYATCDIGCDLRILKERNQPGVLPTLSRLDAVKAKRRNRVITILDANGNPKPEKVFELWMDWHGRADYDGIEFEPGGSRKRNYYNLWQGLPIEAKTGDWSLLHDHVRHIICHDNAEWYNWLMTWCAQIVQQPGVKLGSSVTFMGKRGTGKTKLLEWFMKILGDHAIKVSQTSHITGQFTGHHQGVLLLVAEEAFWAGDKQASGALKDMITSEMSMMERKGLDAVRTTNYSRLAFISNESWVVPAGLEDERRYFVLEVKTDKQKDTTYFRAIDDQMRSGGLEAMTDFLMRWVPPYKIGWDELRDPPKTPWLLEQGLEGLSEVDDLLIEMVKNGRFTFDGNVTELHEDSENIIPSAHIRGYLREQAKKPIRGHFERVVVASAKEFLQMTVEPASSRKWQSGRIFAGGVPDGFKGSKASSSAKDNKDNKDNMHCFTLPGLAKMRDGLAARRLIHASYASKKDATSAS